LNGFNGAASSGVPPGGADAKSSWSSWPPSPQAAESVGHYLDHRPVPVLRHLPCEEGDPLLSEVGNALTCAAVGATCLAGSWFLVESRNREGTRRGLHSQLRDA
jgi:hypothetical protein